jgi:hypothetical protein
MAYNMTKQGWWYVVFSEVTLKILRQQRENLKLIKMRQKR